MGKRTATMSITNSSRFRHASRVSTLLLSALPMLLVLAACGSDDGDDEGDGSLETFTPAPAEPTAVVDPGISDLVTVSGEVTYRERIAMAPDSVASVTLQDISRADAAAEVLAEQTITFGDRQVPLPFALEVERSEFVDGNRCAVRAQITDANGELLFTTDSTNPVEVGTSPTVDMGTLVLVAVAGS